MNAAINNNIINIIIFINAIHIVDIILLIKILLGLIGEDNKLRILFFLYSTLHWTHIIITIESGKVIPEYNNMV